jgi:hypothetical protein
MNQRTYESLGLGLGQMHRIYRFLKKHLGKWIPMPRIAKAASPTGNGTGLSPRSRIFDLRKSLAQSPYTIETRIEKSGRIVKTWYRMVRA